MRDDIIYAKRAAQRGCGRENMRKRLLVMLLMALIAVSGVAHAGGDAVVERFDADYTVREDGVIAAEERLVYRTTDDINGFTRDMDPALGSGYDGFSVAEVRGSAETRLEYDAMARKGDAGVYRYEALDNGLNRYYVHIPCEDGDRVELVYRYEIYGACARYADVGVISLPLLGDAWELDIEDYSARVSLSGGNGSDMDVRVMSAGMDMDTCEAVDGGFVFKGRNAGDGEAFRVRLMFPQELVPGMALTEDKPMREYILASEAEYDATLQRNNSLGWALLALLVAGSILLSVAAHRLWGRDPAVNVNMYSSGMALPSTGGATPAELAVDIKRAVPDEDALASTLLDLARRGYIELEYDDSDMTYVRTDKPYDDCAPHERFAMDWIFSLGNGMRVSMEEIKQKAEHIEYAKAFSSWQSMVKESAEERIWYEKRTPAQKATGSVILAAGATGIIGAIICLAQGALFSIMALGLGLGGLSLVAAGVFALVMCRHTAEGAQIAADWISVRDWIKKEDWSADVALIDTALWEQLMVYALVLDADAALAAKLDNLDPSYADAMRASHDAVLLRARDSDVFVEYGMYGYYCAHAASSMRHASSSSGGGSAGSGSGGGGGGGTF